MSLDHRNYDTIKQLISQQFDNGVHDTTYDCCIKNELIGMPHPKATKFRESRCLKPLPSDTTGPFKIPTIWWENRSFSFCR